MVRIIDGHGLRMIRKPPWLTSTGFPSSVTISASIPGRGRVHEPGLSGVIGVGEIRIEPVSVIHQVSITGKRSPVTRRYQSQASGLIGSPTVPSKRRLDRS